MTDREWDGSNRGVHLAHCNRGEYLGVCKYGYFDCPAQGEPPATAPQWLFPVEWERPQGITEKGLNWWQSVRRFDGQEYLVGPDGCAWRYPELAAYLDAFETWAHADHNAATRLRIAEVALRAIEEMTREGGTYIAAYDLAADVNDIALDALKGSSHE